MFLSKLVIATVGLVGVCTAALAFENRAIGRASTDTLRSKSPTVSRNANITRKKPISISSYKSNALGSNKLPLLPTGRDPRRQLDPTGRTRQLQAL